MLAAAPDDPAAQVTPDVVVGSHTDLDDLRRVAAGADVLTFDHEHVPTSCWRNWSPRASTSRRRRRPWHTRRTSSSCVSG
ncbi:N5-carboxyaminoimidazole ribonucleotide synthase domain protein [Mycobacterium xenopi 4042]|uniref:N5-carboxyaminoimidazole ribonucleotide synthase domain protein n=1 Tax=Mycobacterium xenopi 4042 TaxID=1299334 RepID=X7YJK7_MYCXE|nr:N5-carboxyaminoimidazole ribonucleotide synthase domain protein [Mycobacterium xenopi 4042]